MRRVYIKQGVVLSPMHWKRPEVARIITAVDIAYPKDCPLVITRGFEQCKGGKKHSRHLPPFYAAFDFRTKHLREDINRAALARRIQRGLGPDYYVYFGEVDTQTGKVEWIHVQWNGEI